MLSHHVWAITVVLGTNNETRRFVQLALNIAPPLSKWCSESGGVVSSHKFRFDMWRKTTIELSGFVLHTKASECLLFHWEEINDDLEMILPSDGYHKGIHSILVYCISSKLDNTEHGLQPSEIGLTKQVRTWQLLPAFVPTNRARNRFWMLKKGGNKYKI